MALKDRQRDTFAADELAIVLSHYNLGPIESITEFSRGSRRSPKVGIVSTKGKYLLKRRDPRRADIRKVRFAHCLQAHLAARGFPLPALIPPVDAEDPAHPLLILQDRMYELFEYIPGQSYRGTVTETADAGRVLAEFHAATRQFDPGEDCPRGDYHDANAVRTGLNQIPGSIDAHESVVGHQAELLGTINYLYDVYDAAAEAVSQTGVLEQGEQIIHSDWHPGNMLFRNDRVAAVIDYDSARLSHPVVDLANGALQFSMLSGTTPEDWPDELDTSHIRRFARAYGGTHHMNGIDPAAVPHLMIEALIAETAVPIALTGSFGRWQGFRFMQMVRRKVAWMREHVDEIARCASR